MCRQKLLNIVNDINRHFWGLWDKLDELDQNYNIQIDLTIDFEEQKFLLSEINNKVENLKAIDLKQIKCKRPLG